MASAAAATPPPADYDAEEEAAKLKDSELYSRDVLPLLEEALGAQVVRGTYNSRNNLAILKLYQLYPEMMQREVVEHILVKALMNLPEPCFQMALYMLPQNIQNKPSVSLLIDLENKLHTGQFKEFWATRAIDEARALVDKVPGFDDACRRFVAMALTVTYQKIAAERLAESLAISDIRPLIQSQGWALEEGCVSFPLNSENQPQPRTKSEEMTAEGMSSVVSILTTKSS